MRPQISEEIEPQLPPLVTDNEREWEREKRQIENTRYIIIIPM